MWSYVWRYPVNQKVNSAFKLMLDKATDDYMNFLGLSVKVYEIKILYQPRFQT
jgi:hypothetical protein